MSKPTMRISGDYPPVSTALIEDLRLDLDDLADKFDGNIGDSDIDQVSYSKLVLGGNIKNADISGTADIAGTKLADNAITTAKILDANVTLAKLAAGVANKLSGPNASDTALTGFSSATPTTIYATPVSYTPTESGVKILVIGQVTASRNSGAAKVQLACDVAGVSQTWKPSHSIVNTGGAVVTVTAFYLYTFASASAQDVRLMVNGDGSNSFDVASGDGNLWIVEFKRSA